MGSLGDIGGFIVAPLYYAISALLLGFHKVFSLVLSPTGGLAWALSIVGLTLVIRILLIPLFVKQIKSQRNMQLIQPKVKELQKKYGHDRQKLGEETMKLYKDAGTNPFASCLPLLLQMPIFFSLFRLLDQAAKNGSGRGFLSDDQAQDFGSAKIFGQIPISDSFLNAQTFTDNAQGNVGVMIVALILVVAMTATTFTTQRQLMSKNMPADALSGQYAQQQKMLLYVLPLVFGIGGIAFPIGVLLYWTTSNLWTMGQQFYVIRNNPAPGTPAFTAKQERDKAKALAKGEPVAEVAPEPEEPRTAVRQQPKRTTKAQRKQAAAGSKPLPPSAKSAPSSDAGGAITPRKSGGSSSANRQSTSKNKKQGGRR